MFGGDGATATALNTSSATATLGAGLIFLALGTTEQNSGALLVTATSITDQYANATGIGVGGLLAVGAVTAEADAKTSTTVELGTYATAYVQGSFTLQATGIDTDVAKAIAGNGGVLAGTGAGASTTNDATVTATIDDATTNDDGSVNNAAITAQTITIGAAHTDNFFAGADTTQASALGASAAVARSEASISPTVKIGIDALLIGDALGSTSSAAVSIEAANTFNEQTVAASANAAAGGGINGTGASSSISLNGTSSVVIGSGAGLLAGTGATAGAMNIVADTTVTVADLVTLQTGGAIEGSSASSTLDASFDNTVVIGSGANLLAFGKLDIGTYTFAIVNTSAYNSTSGLVDGGSAIATTNLSTLAVRGRQRQRDRRSLRRAGPYARQLRRRAKWIDDHRRGVRRGGLHQGLGRCTLRQRHHCGRQQRRPRHRAPARWCRACKTSTWGRIPAPWQPRHTVAVTASSSGSSRPTTIIQRTMPRQRRPSSSMARSMPALSTRSMSPSPPARRRVARPLSSRRKSRR